MLYVCLHLPFVCCVAAAFLANEDEYGQIFAVDRVPVFNALVRSQPLNSGFRNFASIQRRRSRSS